MSVQSNSPVTSANVNGAFMSRTVNTSTIGTVSLENTGSATVSDVQQLLNYLKWTVSTNELISASGTVTISTADLNQVRTISGSSAAVTASTTPLGTAAPTNGTVVRLIGTHDTNTVSFTHNDNAKGLLLNGNCTLARGNMLELMFNVELDRWVEITRNF